MRYTQAVAHQPFDVKLALSRSEKTFFADDGSYHQACISKLTVVCTSFDTPIDWDKVYNVIRDEISRQYNNAKRI